MTTYTWNCKTVDAYPSYDELTDVVYNVHWILAGERTEADVTYSIESAMGEEAVAEKKATIDAELESQINPTTVTITIGA
jgi:hypothetical protein